MLLGPLRRLVRRALLGERATLSIRGGTVPSMLRERATPVELKLALADGGELVLEPLLRTRGRLGLKNFDPCTILLNTDLNAGVPGILEDLHEQYLLPPLPNTLYTRDTTCWIYGGVTLNSLYWPARHEETILTTAIYKFHPDFAGKVNVWWGDPTQDHGLATLEGGDVMPIGKGNVQAVNYFVAQKYVEALHAFATGPNNKTLLLPVEATSILSSLAGIGEVAKQAFGKTSYLPDMDWEPPIDILACVADYSGDPPKMIDVQEEHN